MADYKINDQILTDIADQIRVKTNTNERIKAKDMSGILHTVDVMNPMNCVPTDLENGFYGIRAAKVAESYLYARQISGVVWNYAVNGIFYNNQPTSTEDSKSDIGDDVELNEDLESSNSDSNFSNYDPSTTSGFRLFGYAAKPIGKNPNIIGNLIDCSVFVSLVLRGIPYEHSPWVEYGDPEHGVYTWNPANIINLTGNEGWEQKELDYQPEGVYTDLGIPGYSSIRTAADLASYYYRAGKVLYDRPIYTCEDRATNIPTQEEILALLQPGDLIFWANRSNVAQSGEEPSYAMTQPNRFRCVSHVAIVSTNITRTIEVTHGSAPTSLPHGIYYRVLRNEGVVRRLDGITLIIRPDYRPKARKEEVPLNTNLCIYPWTFGQLKTTSSNGITREILSKDTIHISGLSNESFFISLKGSIDNQQNYLTLTPGVYQLSGMSNTEVQNATFAIQVRHLDGSDFETPIRCYEGNNPEFTITTKTKVQIRLYFGANVSIDCNIQPTLIRIS